MSFTEHIICIDTKTVHAVELTKQGENTLTCPECSHLRSKKSDKCLGYNFEKEYGYCHHCNNRFVKYVESKPVEYHKPKFENYTKLNEASCKWFLEDRGIGQKSLNKLGVVGKTRNFGGKDKYCICFPFKKCGKVVNVKYRSASKEFQLERGAELIWYNHDALLSNKKVIITEGEIDALSFIEDGFENVISVPNGAAANKMPYFESSIDLLDKVETFYIAVDNDSKGIELRDELVRRLGAERCKICIFKRFKDANEYLLAEGRDSLKEVINSAKSPKIQGVYSAEDFEPDIRNLFENGLLPGKTTGHYQLDKKITWESKRLAIFTGTPSSGKSEFMDFITVKLNLKHGWKVAYWSPENFPLDYHYAKLATKLIGCEFHKDKCSYETYHNVLNNIKSNYFWVAPDENMTIENILDKMRYLVKSKGIKVVCIDPWNKLEKKFTNGETELKHISRILDLLTTFAKVNDVLVCLVAHPKKLQRGKDGSYPMPTMSDISGSSDFWNKTDYGVCIARRKDKENNRTNEVDVLVEKIKFRHLGEGGLVTLKYNYNNGRYEEEDSNVNTWDNSSWLQTQRNPEKQINDPENNPEQKTSNSSPPFEAPIS